MSYWDWSYERICFLSLYDTGTLFLLNVDLPLSSGPLPHSFNVKLFFEESRVPLFELWPSLEAIWEHSYWMLSIYYLGAAHYCYDGFSLSSHPFPSMLDENWWELCPVYAWWPSLEVAEAQVMMIRPNSGLILSPDQQLLDFEFVTLLSWFSEFYAGLFSLILDSLLFGRCYWSPNLFI